MDDLDVSLQSLKDLQARDPETYEVVRREVVAEMNAVNEKLLGKYRGIISPRKIKFKRSWWKK